MIKTSLAIATLLIVSPIVQAFSVGHLLHRRMEEAALPASNADTYWYEQTLDHFDPDNTATFQQRYFFNTKHHQVGGPMFVYIGGEGPLSGGRVEAGFITELAAKHGAVVMALEHRYYGQSVPFDVLSRDNLDFLTSQQALEDLAQWITAMRTSHGFDCEDCKVIMFGGSYPGNLSAWFRLVHPEIATASLASSGPVLALSAYYQYDQAVSEAFDRSGRVECRSGIQAASAALDALIENPDTYDATLARFDASAMTNPTGFLYMVADTIAFAVQYNSAAAPMMDNLCDNIEAASSDEELVDALVANAKYCYGATATPPEQWDIIYYTEEKPVGEYDNMRQWFYQSCREFGYFQVAPEEDSIRSAHITEQYHLDVCATLYGEPAMIPDIDGTNEFYGERNIDTTRVYFSNGSSDPWAKLSILEDRPEIGLPAGVIEAGSHCNDLGPSRDSDSESLREVRAAFAAYLEDWLSE